MAIDAAYLDERRRAPRKMRNLVFLVAHMYAHIRIPYHEDAKWSSFNKKRFLRDSFQFFVEMLIPTKHISVIESGIVN